MPDTYKQTKRVLINILFLNWLVALTKIILGVYSGALSILSDGTHSFFDGLTNLIGFFGIKLAEKPADENHAYGHRKYEAIFAQIILFFLIIAAWEIIQNIYAKFLNPQTISINAGWTTVIILASCIIIDAVVANYEFKKGKKLNSTILKADAMHTRSHYVTTGSVMIGTILIKAGLPPEIDLIMAIIVVLFIAKMSYEIFMETTSILSDENSIKKEEVEKIIKIATLVPGVKSCHKIRSRGDRNHIFVDIHIVINPEFSLKKAHDICHEAVERIQRVMPEIKDITAHPEPK